MKEAEWSGQSHTAPGSGSASHQSSGVSSSHTYSGSGAPGVSASKSSGGGGSSHTYSGSGAPGVHSESKSHTYSGSGAPGVHSESNFAHELSEPSVGRGTPSGSSATTLKGLGIGQPPLDADYYRSLGIMPGVNPSLRVMPGVQPSLRVMPGVNPSLQVLPGVQPSLQVLPGDQISFRPNRDWSTYPDLGPMGNWLERRQRDEQLQRREEIDRMRRETELPQGWVSPPSWPKSGGVLGPVVNQESLPGFAYTDVANDPSKYPGGQLGYYRGTTARTTNRPVTGQTMGTSPGVLGQPQTPYQKMDLGLMLAGEIRDFMQKLNEKYGIAGKTPVAPAYPR